MDDEKIERLDKVAVLTRNIQDDKHLNAIFSRNLEKKKEIKDDQDQNKSLINIFEYFLFYSFFFLNLCFFIDWRKPLKDNGN